MRPLRVEKQNGGGVAREDPPDTCQHLRQERIHLETCERCIGDELDRSPALVSLERLRDDGLLAEDDPALVPAQPGARADFEASDRRREGALRRAFERASTNEAVRKKVIEFSERFAFWLGNKQATLIYAVLYFVVLGPVALVRQVVSDPLLVRGRARPTFWQPRGQAPPTLAEARRQ